MGIRDKTAGAKGFRFSFLFLLFKRTVFICHGFVIAIWRGEAYNIFKRTKRPKEVLLMKKRLLAAGMAAFLLTSCSSLFEPIGESSGSSGSESSAAESSGTEEQNAPLLSFRIQDETFIVNTAGKEILSGKNLWLIQDLFTNEAPFITKSRYEAVKRDEDGWIEQHRTFTTVYDRNGKEIQSETEGDLNAVFGDYVVWMESNDSINGKLVRRSTGEVLFNDVNSTAKLGSSYVVVITIRKALRQRWWTPTEPSASWRIFTASIPVGIPIILCPSECRVWEPA